MQTKLPQKVSGADTVGLGYWKSEVNEMNVAELQRSFNQLIDYLAELTAVVEDKQWKLDNEYARGFNDGVREGKHQTTPHYMLGHPETPTLKEQLLGEIKDLLKPEHEDMRQHLINTGYNTALSEVEAIINRLIK